MLAMQYSFTLPADYDMDIIRERIASKGHLFDTFPQLRFKAFQFACRDQPHHHAQENCYAPFYVWESNAGMNEFLSSSGFAALVGAFGWPTIRNWSVWETRMLPTMGNAQCATREIVAIAPHTALAELQKAEVEQVRIDIEQLGALAGVVGFEPTTWTLVRYRLWPDFRADFARAGVQVYEIGHLSIPDKLAIAD